MDKQHILDEIRRTSVGDKPLGKRQFLAQTGIKESDWSGRYWARWSDAQAEAGFVGQSPTPAFDDYYLLTCVLEFMRKLGSFPTAAEMRLEKRRNPTFPNERVIGRRWNRATFIEKLLAFCNTHPEYRDIEPILKSKSSKTVSVGDHNDPSPAPTTGYVYVIRAQGAYKIGCTRAPYRRAAEIANQSANGAELLHLISTDDPEGIEKYWHGRFSVKRLNGINKQSGEWFALSAEDVRIFKKRKFM